MPRKKKEVKIEKVKDVLPEATEAEVQYALNFAKEYFSSSMYGNMFGSFNPMMTNARLQDASFSPAIGTSEDIERALNNPKSSENLLLSYGQNLEVQSMLYKRLLNYMGRMLSFDLNYVCVTPDVDYNSAQYKKDKRIVMNFFDKFDIVDEFTKVMELLIREEAGFYFFRRDSDFKWGLQQLPSNYCLLTGRLAGELIYDFSMTWFLNAGIDINMYPPIFKKYYNRAFEGVDGTKYIPSAPADQRDGSWAYYVQTSPDDGFYAFKLFPQLATRIPLFSAMYPDIALQPLYRQLSKTNAMQSAVKLLLGEVGILKDVKAGSLSNAFNIDSTNLGRFLQLIRNSIDTTIGVAAAPLSNLNKQEFSLNDRNVYDESMAVSAASSGSNARMFYTSTKDRQNVFESEQNLSVDEYLISPAYRMFETFLNRYVNELTKKHKFKFMLSGTNFSYARKKKMSDFTTMAGLGIFNPTLAASSMNMSRFDLERMLEQTKSEGWVDKLTPIVPAFQQSANDNSSGSKGKGRPQKETDDLTEEGSETRASGDNLDKGGDV